MHKPCAEPGCVTLAVFNQPGAGHGLYCGQHKPMGYVNVKVLSAVHAGGLRLRCPTSCHQGAKARPQKLVAIETS